MKLNKKQLRKIIRESLTSLTNPENESIYTMEDWKHDGTLKVKEGQLIAPEVYWQLLESMPPISNGNIFQPGEAYDHDWKTGQPLYQTVKREGDDLYRYIGLQPASHRISIRESQLAKVIKETVQSQLVKVLGKYTLGKATSKEANKAIMDLANASNEKVNESLDDEMKEWEARDKSAFGQTLKQLQEIANYGLIDAGDAMSNIRTVYALDGDEQKTLRRVKSCLSNYDFILVEDNGDINTEESNSPEAARLVIQLSQLANNKITEGDGDSPYYAERHDLENKQIENQGNMKWGKSLKEIKEPEYQETHFAVNKTTGKIVNGWDYREYDPEELRTFKKDYFIQDLIDNDLDPKQYTILTKASCIKRGINPDINSNWANA